MRWGLRLAVSLLLLIWLGGRTDWERVGQLLPRLWWGAWLTAGGLLLLAQLLSARRWQLLARALGLAPSWWQCVRWYFIGMFFNLVLPTSIGGDGFRAWYLAQGQAERWPVALGSVLWDRVSGLVVLLALALGGWLWAPPGLPGWLPLLLGGAALAVTGGLLLLPVLACWRRGPRLVRLLAGSAAPLGQPSLLGRTTLLSLGVQLANIHLVACLGQTLNIPVPLTSYYILVPVVCLLAALPLSINGMGVREGALVVLLASWGVDAAAALTLAFAWFAVNTALSLLGGLVYLLGSPQTSHTAQEQKEARESHGPVGGDSDQGRAGQPAAAA